MDFVDKRQFAVDEAHFVFGVDQDETGFGGDGLAAFEQHQSRMFDFAPQAGRNARYLSPAQFMDGDLLVVTALGGFGGGGDDGSAAVGRFFAGHRAGKRRRVGGRLVRRGTRARFW